MSIWPIKLWVRQFIVSLFLEMFRAPPFPLFPLLSHHAKEEDNSLTWGKTILTLELYPRPWKSGPLEKKTEKSACLGCPRRLREHQFNGMSNFQFIVVTQDPTAGSGCCHQGQAYLERRQLNKIWQHILRTQALWR